MTNMLTATKDINAHETITEDAFTNKLEKFQPGQQMPDVVREPEILVKLKPIRKIPKGEFFYSTYFDRDELEAKQEEFFERNRDRND